MNEKVKVKHSTYNEGFLEYGSIKTIRNIQKIKIGEKFESIGKLPFQTMTIRDNDNYVANSLGYTINKKVKVPYRSLPKNIKIKIDDEIYDVVKKDSSDNINLYIYLQIATNKGEKYD